MNKTLRLSLAGLLFSVPSFVGADEPAKVSFHQQIKPILQASCEGCHQPAKPSGKYVMTDFAKLIGKGESDEVAVVPGKPDESALVKLITPVNGEAAMPKGKKPLHASEIELIRRWIAEGATNDTPANAVEKYDTEHPPVYVLPPVLTSLDFSPDGKLIAVAGFHEVLLHNADGSGIVARLVGLSERVQSVKFSPDGKRLAVSGGRPGRMGEVQVWDVEKKELKLSHTVTFDTVYGASWSPDGTRIAFGCADNTIRAINAETGEQVLYQGAHSDWVLGTVWNPAGDHVMSVSRDRTVKLTEVATQRFIDNVTSITPGALRGGVEAIDTHPERDEIIVGGADGTPKLYRIFRITARVIGDDANLIRELTPLRGRVFGVDYSADGKRAVAGSSLDGKGDIVIYDTDVDTRAPEDIKAIMKKRVQQQNDDEKKKLAEYQKQSLPVIAKIGVEESGIFAVKFSPDGKVVAAGGSDGRVRLYDASNGQPIKDFLAVPVADAQTLAAANAMPPVAPAPLPTPLEQLNPADALTGLSIEPSSVTLAGAFDKAQLVITGKTAAGDAVDVTRMVTWQLSKPGVVSVAANGQLSVVAAGETELKAVIGQHSVAVPVKVASVDVGHVDYIRDVTPVLSRLGCNQGTCHGAKEGKNGFKLSLRGYDPIFDTRAFTDELASRRANVASPELSLMLLKATGSVPHVGGQLVKPGHAYYEIIRRWIGSGAKLNLQSPRVVSISVSPINPVVQRIGSRQQMRILATYSDGAVRDVTSEAFIESSNTDIAKTDATGLVSTLRRGEAAILARYEGRYAATTVTVMGDRTGFAWQEPAKWNNVDELVARKLERMKILPSDLCSDYEFIRRVYLDLTGLPPSADDVRKFVDDQREAQVKRYELIDRLIGTDEFIDHWTNKWADLLQVNSKFLGAPGAKAFRDWIRAEVAANTPYDQFAMKVLTASGSNRENPAASYFKILRTPQDTMENTTHLWLAVRFNCNKCHDHPFEKWTQDQYYQTAAFFAQFGLQADPESKDQRIGGTAVEGAKPLYEIVVDRKDGEVRHDRTGELTPPAFPFDAKFEAAAEASRREKLAKWITSPDNQYFAKSYVNRIWGYLMGVGLIEPLDDIRAGNPPSNPELLDALTKQFIDSGFNVRELMRTICRSRTYQMSLASNQWNADDRTNYSHAVPKRLTAEVLYDAIHKVTGSTPKIPGVAPGTRAAQLPDAGINLPDGFLKNFGRPARESACECERSAGVALGPVMALVSGPTVGNAISDGENAIAKLIAAEPDDRKLINEVFLRVLNRPAKAEEIDATIAAMNGIEADHQALLAMHTDREKFWAEKKPQLEREREDAIKAAQADLTAYEQQIAPRIAEMQKAKDAEIAKLDADLKAYEAGLAGIAAGYLKANANAVEWHLLEPASLSATNNIRLERLEDRSIRASGEADKSVYTLTFETSLQNITGFRLEALPLTDVAHNGPGISDNGNYVVTELEVSAASKAKPAELQKIALQNGKQDFTQQSFDVNQAIDGNLNDQQGWAVSPATGVVHWITAEARQPIAGSPEGTVLKVVIHQNHNAKKHLLGRFRLAVTTAKAPIGLGLPESLKAIASVEESQRSESQNKLVLDWFRKIDPTLAGKQAALATARQPLPEDPGVTQRKSVLAFVSKPVPEDARLQQLKADVDFSTKQLASRRLTAAQDLTWALINSPEFLFNH